MASDHHHHHAAARDTGAAFTGLIGGMIFLLAVVFGIVKWTNARYAGGEHGGANAAAESTH